MKKRALLLKKVSVLLCGEDARCGDDRGIRDRETAEIAVHAALTGHLVLSTLHTNDAVSAPAA